MSALTSVPFGIALKPNFSYTFAANTAALSADATTVGAKKRERLRDWLGVSRETFYDPERVALLPMDFYFPGPFSFKSSPFFHKIN